jgi:hypothetical protein
MTRLQVRVRQLDEELDAARKALVEERTVCKERVRQVLSLIALLVQWYKY